VARRKRCPRCSMPVVRGRCLNSEYQCNWPDEKKVRPKLEPLPADCFARCNKGHPVRGKITKHKTISKTRFALEVTYRCKICGTECIVTSRAAETRIVPQREFIFEMLDQNPGLAAEISEEEREAS